MAEQDALLEDILDRLKSIQEGLDAQSTMPERLERVEQKVDKLQEDLNIVKSVIPEQGDKLNKAESEIEQIKTKLGAG